MCTLLKGSTQRRKHFSNAPSEFERQDLEKTIQMLALRSTTWQGSISIRETSRKRSHFTSARSPSSRSQRRIVPLSQPHLTVSVSSIGSRATSNELSRFIVALLES